MTRVWPKLEHTKIPKQTKLNIEVSIEVNIGK
jgi:hypothetical protein